MGIFESLDRNSYKEKDHKVVSECWNLLTVKAEDLRWFTNSSTASNAFHEQILVVKTPEKATGHKGITHGGCIATLLDETLCYGAYPVLPHQTGVTASLSVEYKAPTLAGTWIAIRTIARSSSGSRKATVEGQVYPINLEQDELPWESEAVPAVTAEQIVVEPKWHDKLSNSK